ncbi:alcohol dehydrogenase catalytic domain-containing protein [Nocardioides sp. JQ2195]|uniref:alcohol dehydrogenase catalytic domain-containing protein n=1 Tax=Nocardioides sp. JQ2195 TaxID=2592334 RepID=UPI00197D168E|nr:alcohol dehydrogenase catalytic domain-containing protein [Nocardioides sp. JQ2195]
MRVKVEASGICRADLGTAGAARSAHDFPVVPGHEVAGVVDDLGPGSADWSVGDRVAAGVGELRSVVLTHRARKANDETQNSDQ